MSSGHWRMHRGKRLRLYASVSYDHYRGETRVCHAMKSVPDIASRS